MRHIPLLTCLILCVSSCKQDWSVPVPPCTLPIQDSSQQNLKAGLYQALLNRHVQQGVPGLTLLVRTPNEGLWIGAAGKAKVETGEPMLPCHIYNAASVTKMYIGVATMMLVEEGKIDLDAQINTYLDRDLCNKIDNANKVTIRQLMNHSSGIHDFIYENAHLMDYFNEADKFFSTKDLLGYIYAKKADFEPGAKAAYCNTNTVLLSMALDQVTGRHHADFITERIIKKRKLVNTFYKNEPGYPSPAGLVNSYFDRYSSNHLENITALSNNFQFISVGHDGMFASPLDFATFIEAVFKGGLLSTNSLKEMMQWKSSNDGRGLYGLGIFRSASSFVGHRGGGIGSALNVHYNPEKDVTIVWCANYSDFFDTPVSSTMVNFDDEVEKIALR